MSLRIRLLLAAVGIVAISLLLSGALTWFLVQQLELSTAREQLDRLVVIDKAQIVRRQCTQVPAPPAGSCPRGGLADQGAYVDRLQKEVGPTLQGDRLLLLDGTNRVLFDSQASNAGGEVISLSPPRQVAGQKFFDVAVTRGGADYVGVASQLTPSRDPLGAHWLVLLRDKGAISGQAASKLLAELVAAGLLALLVSVAIALLLGRTLTRPLTELALASEEIAAGNYSRRVSLSGGPEIGTVGAAFNRMAGAVERARTLQRDFLANVSHELKTPLTSLIGFSQAMLDGSASSPAEQRRAATIVNEEAHRVLRMAQELLDLARVESGQISIRVQPVDLGAMLEQEVELVRPRARERNIDLQLITAAELPPVRADPERLHQILDNLLDNAVKYAPQGSRVDITAQARDGVVETSIVNPVGSPSPDPARMFDRFYRGDPSRASVAGGVGLGLAISKELADAQMGRLWAELDGQGALRVRLTLEPASPAEAGGATAATAASAPPV